MNLTTRTIWPETVSMSDTDPLAMLALRRVHDRVLNAIDRPGGVNANGDTNDADVLTGGDRQALGRVLRRAVERTWLTLELLFCREAIGARLGRAGQQTLEAIFRNRCFDSLITIPAPFRETIWRELHTARKAGPFAHAELSAEHLIGQISNLSRAPDARALHDLEWYALWQIAGELTREGYHELRTLFEARAPGGESLLIGLVTSFIPFELELEGSPARFDLGPGILPDEHVRWLSEHSEPIEVFLNEEHSGPRSSSPAETASRIRQGLSYSQQGEYERAAIEFTAAIQSDHMAVAPYVHRGDAYRLRGEYLRAIADYSQALRLDANNLLARLNRGLVHRLTGRAEAAVADLTEAIRLDPRNVVALNARGSANADLGHYDLAIADHTQALRLDPALSWAHQSRGDAYAGKGEYDQAIADYTQALQLSPHFALAYANRGNSYRLSGNLDRAAADYTEALRLDPVNPRMFTSRGDTYRRQSRFDLALADYGEAIRLDPTNPASYINRGIVYQQSGDYDRSVEDFDRAEQFDSANPAVFFQRALAKQHQRSYEAAIVDLHRAIDLNPRDAVARISRGSLYTRQRQYDRAIDDYTEAIRLDPLSAQAYQERGRVHALCGMFDEALEDSGAALRLDPHFVPAFLIRGGVLIRTGQYEAAVQEFDQAIRINPRYDRAYNDRGVALSKLGRLDDAVRDFTRAVELDPEHVQAISNRGNAYQLLQRHDHALQDFAQAVAADTKYAAAYSLQRGLVEVARGNHRQALADFSVALVIDPENRAARAARATAQAQIDTGFALGPVLESAPTAIESDPAATAMAPATEATAERPAAPETQLVDLTDALVTEDESAGPASEAAVAAPPESDRAEYEAEQRQQRAADQKARLQALAEKAAEIRQRNELEEAKRKAQADKRKAKGVRKDPEVVAEQWRRRKQYAVITVGTLIACYWLVPAVWSLIPRAKNPFQTVTAEHLAGEYTKDSAAADDKFADQMLCVRGRLNLVVDKKLRVRNVPPRVFFALPGQKDEFRIECQFDDPDMATGLDLEREYWVVGKIDRFKRGTGVVIKNATFLPTSAQSGTAALRLDRLAMATEDAPARRFPDVVATRRRSESWNEPRQIGNSVASSKALQAFANCTHDLTRSLAHTPRVVGC